MKRPLALYSHPDCLLHDGGPGHPERPERLTALERHLQEVGLWADAEVLQAKPASRRDLEGIHDPAYLQRVEAHFARGASYVDHADANGNDATFTATRLASGAAIDATQRVLQGEFSRAFVMLRPPGHHAEVDRAMGFCFSNHVALAAHTAREKYGLKRVAIVDFDVHHGNGTQHIFEKDHSVFYASLHQWPHYPGTGSPAERGLGPGEGATLNCPLPAKSGDAAWQAALEEQILPALESFAPELLLISAGFDGHERDPLSDTRLSRDGFFQMTRALCDFAQDHGQGRVISILEGGYDLQGLCEGAEAHLVALMADAPPSNP